MDVRAVIFDWGGTLTPWHTIDLDTQWHGFASAYDPGDAGLAARLAAAEAEAWARGRAEHSSAGLAEIVGAAGVDVAAPGYSGAEQAYADFWTDHTLTDPLTRETVESLTGMGMKVGVLSNTIWPAAWHDDWFERDGVLDLFPVRLYTSDLPWIKPHRKVFEAAIEAVGETDPATCVYVGDRVFEDVHGPQQIGMRTIWVPHSDIPESQQVAGVDAEPDAVAHRLTDVAAIVATWLGR